MAKRYSKEIKQEVLGRIRGGQRVVEVARAYGISEMTVRTWLERDAAGGNVSALEVGRLRRENETLLKIIGQLKVEAEKQKKNQRRGRF
jgi:transposase-like protein